MLVLMTWYSDGSSDPDLYFFEEDASHDAGHPILRFLPKLIEEVECRKKVAVYKIGALDKQPILLFPKE